MKKDLIIINDWYKKLVIDLRRLAFEGIVKTKYAIGKRILVDELKFNKPEYGSKRIENLAKDLETSSRDLWRCIQFAKKCHSVTQFTNKSWHYICNCYLPIPKKEIKTSPLPEGKYNCILADPPWEEWESGNRGPEQHYTTWDVFDICRLPVSELAADNCILFLWTTGFNIQDAFQVIKAWGFHYSCFGFVWVKSLKDGNGFAFGCGNWTRANAEYCLIGLKGNVERRDATISQIIYAPREAHSKKPDIVRNKIVQLVGDLPRIELFARGKAPEGWEVWGDEIEKSEPLDILREAVI